MLFKLEIEIFMLLAFGLDCVCCFSMLLLYNWEQFNKTHTAQL